MAFYYFGIYSFGCAGAALLMFIIGKLFCKRVVAKEEEADHGEDDEAAEALQTDGEEKEADAKKVDEEELEEEMVVAVKINTINAT